MNYDLEMRDQLVARLRRRLNKVLDEKAKAARFDMQNAYDYLNNENHLCCRCINVHCSINRRSMNNEI
jgi:hypothetical protein